MAFPGKEIICGLILAAAAHAVTFEARHEHLHKGCPAEVTVDQSGVAFSSPKHKAHWKWQDIEQVKLAADELDLTTYEDRALLLGADREYKFRGAVPKDVYLLLKDHLDQRFVAELADPALAASWQIPAKHLRTVKGSQGVLRFGGGRIVYQTAASHDSRTWRFADIQNISSAGPFELTITSFERPYHFELKQVLPERQFTKLWREIQKSNGSIQQ